MALILQKFGEEELSQAEQQARLNRDRKDLLNLDDELKSCIRDYLRNPTRTGLWNLQAPWLSSAGITKDILSQLHAKVKSRTEGDSTREGHRSRILAARLERFGPRVRSMSFLLEFFKFMRLSEQGGEKLQDNIMPEHIMVLEHLDFDSIKSAYRDAYDYFVNHLDCPELTTRLRPNKISCCKAGVFIMAESLTARNQLRILSIKPEPLEHLNAFFLKIGKIGEARLRMVFSPEEEVFEAYFPFVREVHHVIDKHARLGSLLLERAIEEYESERFSSCINALGLIAEDYLTQVYETLFREIAPKGRTLGQINDDIHKAIRDTFKKEPPEAADLDAIYKQINRYMASAQGSPEAGTKEALGSPEAGTKEALSLIRALTNALKAERACVRASLKDLSSKDAHVSVFPSHIKNLVHELTRYRNAAAHKTRVPLGNYEALRTIYALVAFVMWWDEELNLIDWKSDKLAILESMINRAGV